MQGRFDMKVVEEHRRRSNSTSYTTRRTLDNIREVGVPLLMKLRKVFHENQRNGYCSGYVSGKRIKKRGAYAVGSA